MVANSLNAKPGSRPSKRLQIATDDSNAGDLAGNTGTWQ